VHVKRARNSARLDVCLILWVLERELEWRAGVGRVENEVGEEVDAFSLGGDGGRVCE
jgi:hypothetical protein